MLLFQLEYTTVQFVISIANDDVREIHLSGFSGIISLSPLAKVILDPVNS